ncbi:MAG: flagellar basal body rod protein FlgB [Pseudomonadota bacterium]|nr:flagellar basal body rod protein FlgB [Pseudomonadota bacterium]MDE3038004.1 flagellar basal body rod protein FlgB [Pseudomonadota bacterium]
MDFSNLSLFGVMKAKMNYLSERQGVLAENIANADTPGYKAKDVTAPDFKKLVGAASQQLQMTMTNPMDMKGTAPSMGAYAVVERGATDELNPNGNNVAIEEEMAKAGKNQMEYQKVLDLYGKAIAMFKTAIGSAGTGG